MLILHIAGNIGIAAYGVIANISLVAMSVFNGISQGTQPLISYTYGSRKLKDVKMLLRLGLIVTFVVQIIVIAGTWIFTDSFIDIFNSEGNEILLYYAHSGMRFYFLGYLFAGVNIMLASYFAAIDRTILAFVASILRGVLAITVCAVIMSRLWGMNGVWLSFLVSEIVTFFVILIMNRSKNV